MKGLLRGDLSKNFTDIMGEMIKLLGLLARITFNKKVGIDFISMIIVAFYFIPCNDFDRQVNAKKILLLSLPCNINYLSFFIPALYSNSCVHEYSIQNVAIIDDRITY